MVTNSPPVFRKSPENVFYYVRKLPLQDTLTKKFFTLKCDKKIKLLTHFGYFLESTENSLIGTGPFKCVKKTTKRMIFKQPGGEDEKACEKGRGYSNSFFSICMYISMQ